MTTPSNVLTDEDLALLRSLPSIGSTGAMADRFTRDQVRKLMADQYVIGEDYLIWRSYHADILIETLDHHTQQARADERRRIVGQLDALRDVDPCDAGSIGTQFTNLKIGLANLTDALAAKEQTNE